MYPLVIHSGRVVGPLDIDRLDELDPFEIDKQAAHLFKHASLGLDDICEVWQSSPLAPSDSGDPTMCRPIGCYEAATHLANCYREDR